MIEKFNNLIIEKRQNLREEHDFTGCGKLFG